MPRPKENAAWKHAVNFLHPDPILPGRERAEYLHGWQRCGAEELRDELGKAVHFDEGFSFNGKLMLMTAIELP